MKVVKRAKILIIEDDVELATTLKEFLELSHFIVTVIHDGEEAIQTFKKETADIVLLDVILPSKNGFEVIAKIRRRNAYVPVIMITGTEFDPYSEIKSYNLGAVMYLKKPVMPQVILAAIKSKLYDSAVSHEYKFGGTHFRIQRQVLAIDGKVHFLREKDEVVLVMLMDNYNHVVDRERIIREIRLEDSPSCNNTLDGIITRLRKQLKEFPFFEVKNSYGNGYILIFDKDKVIKEKKTKNAAPQ